METLEPKHCTPTRIMLPMDGNSESSPFCRSLLPQMPFRHLDYMYRTAFRLKSLQTPNTGLPPPTQANMQGYTSGRDRFLDSARKDIRYLKH